MPHGNEKDESIIDSEVFDSESSRDGGGGEGVDASPVGKHQTDQKRVEPPGQMGAECYCNGKQALARGQHTHRRLQTQSKLECEQLNLS